MSTRVERRLCRLGRRALKMVGEIDGVFAALAAGQEALALRRQAKLMRTAADVAEALADHLDQPPPQRRLHRRPGAPGPR